MATDGGSEVSNEAKTWAMFCQLAGFAKFIFPFGNLILPLIIWQLKKDLDQFVDYHGKESLNFQITITIAFLLVFPTLFVLIGFVLIPAILVFDVVMMIVAALKANNGERFEYPFTIRLVK